MNAPDEPAPSDEAPGLQRERTLLAWTRTLLALAVTAALLARVVGPPWVRPAHVPAATVLVVTLWLLVARDLHYRQGARGRPATSPAHLALAAAAASGTGVVALAALLLS